MIKKGVWIFILFLVSFFMKKKSPSEKISSSFEIDFIVVEKSSRTLSVYQKGQRIKQYKVALGFNPIGHKEKEGDGKTPEGRYYIESKNPNSMAYLSLKISYPSKADCLAAQSKGVNPGGLIMIHGLKNGFGCIGKHHNLVDWTRGCIAVSNEEMKEIYDATKIGTVIEIRP